ncbi:hypothetical protein [Pseudorhodoplanes sinuspersici]|uniref:Uncharacterized protein n=1 Tax=Pseudorhodoplanes sinuspersici TaxID=1235591 RepID=A0A1W6ZNF7_9HYPH|nr:hypothetical protein [Pseudorhodoplanes sinuspersici]ARP98928.1 hypothetical protein CAK95_07420 [Pseudorhodoplanes sinuspersici]RKE69443.1 hypothetical protein DFP91_3874 [Pseudorhodoplanes sinuspersici]
MFEKSLIYRVGVKHHADLGLLAETMFFYGQTQLLLDRSSVVSLSRLLSADLLKVLLDNEWLRIAYSRENFGVLTSGLPQSHDFGVFNVSQTAKGKRLKSHQEEIEEALVREHGNSAETRKLSKIFTDKTELHRFRGVPEKSKIIPDFARQDVQDQAFLSKAVRAILIELVPGFDPLLPFHFRIIRGSNGELFVDSDLNFHDLNQAFHTIVPLSDGSLNEALILNYIQMARADTVYAAYYMAEPVTSSLSSRIMEKNHFEFLRRNISQNDISLFHEIIVPGIPTIREAINSGERTFSEYLNFLEVAQCFKKWLNVASPDVGLVQSYNKDVSKKSWIETLPGKMTRFVVATGVGLGAATIAGPAAGLATGAANSFLLDRILKGWRPNRFIEGSYKKFVQGD